VHFILLEEIVADWAFMLLPYGLLSDRDQFAGDCLFWVSRGTNSCLKGFMQLTGLTTAGKLRAHPPVAHVTALCFPALCFAI
jgi:hypothetical protein